MPNRGRTSFYRDKKNAYRADGTLKGPGYFGTINLPSGATATEYSIGVGFDGRQIQIPTLVPSLSEEELGLMRDDIIPNKRPIPPAIFKKAVEHAIMRMKEDKSPFK